MQGKDYLTILQAITDLPFPVGKKLLICYLKGDDHDSIKRNRLFKLPTFGSLLYSDSEFDEEIRSLEKNGLIEFTGMQGKQYIRVLKLTPKGAKELDHPTLYKQKIGAKAKTYTTEITDGDREIFNSMDFFLKRYNDLQKKAIIADGRNILCIAGAGTGKTTVLTKRVEFLTKFRSVEPRKILAITFTRKARKEMMHRLRDKVSGVQIETFNSFCEKYLKAYGDLVYGRKVRVITFREKITLLHQGLEMLGRTLEQAIDIYFTDSQQRLKTQDQLMFTLLNDCFSIIDIFKVEGRTFKEIDCAPSERAGVELITGLANFITAKMRKMGLRDFTDQLIDCYQFLKKHTKYIPGFDHILVDEYQDVNAMQIELLDLLSPKNLFVVGDPRQSIFGWRGSKVSYILDFDERNKDAEVVSLTTNYRATSPLVKLANASIRKLNLPDLIAHQEGERKINISQAGDEESERQTVLEVIQKETYPLVETFILARTNRQLLEMAQVLKAEKIPHIVKTDEERKPVEPKEGAVTLATIHAIKGLEAEFVILMGATPNNFPCKASDHPILDLMKSDNYDKEEEERRLFYVAITRARKELLITYAGKAMTWFITDEMRKLIDVQGTKKVTTSGKKTGDPYTDLRIWRARTARELGVPAYIIFNDATLQEIVDSMPMSTLDLEDVRGMGKQKVRRYGQEILSILN